MKDPKCPVCGSNAPTLNTVNSKNNIDETLYRCPLCGTFSLENRILDNIFNNTINHDCYDIIKLKSCIFYYLRVIHNHSYNAITHIYQDDYLEGTSIKKIYNLYPKTFSQKIDMVMQLLSTYIKDIGGIFNEYGFENIFFLAISSEQKKETISILKEIGFIKTVNKSLDFTFTPKGWEKIDSLQRNHKSQNVFIAMSFKRKYEPKDSSSTKSLVSSLSGCEESIKSAIQKAGYVPIIIKDKEHNHSIPEEISYEIKNSAFVVADMTLQNNGAYYEAGLAKGLGKDVIFTCAQNDFDSLHFDTKQINTIPWNDLAKFEDDLYKRIKYTIGEYSSLK